jgi:SNF2 family DNA or RNA helicase
MMVRLKVNYIRVDGKIDLRKRYEAVKKFQEDPKCVVAILSLTASSTGITLTAASCVVFAEMNWTPGIMIQAEDRAHRIGQSSSVMVYYIYGEDTLDNLIYPRLRLKSEVIATVVDGKQEDKTFKIPDNADVSKQKLLSKIRKYSSHFYSKRDRFTGELENQEGQNENEGEDTYEEIG